MSEMKIIAHIKTDFPTKFGIPRQSSLANELTGEIIFEPEYRQPEAFRGIEEYSHLWLIWGFSLNSHEASSLTVRPPRLGGNERVGVFASRSPYRPNPIGLSSVKLEKVEKDANGNVSLIVSGADLVSGTPIYDIKPYISFTDCHTDAVCGYADEKKEYCLNVDIAQNLLDMIDENKRKPLLSILSGVL